MGSSRTVGGLNYGYNPSDYTVAGTIPQTNTAEAATQQANYLNLYGTLAAQPTNYGRSVNDLLNTIPGLSGNAF